MWVRLLSHSFREAMRCLGFAQLRQLWLIELERKDA
jgi:hypothetical protein